MNVGFVTSVVSFVHAQMYNNKTTYDECGPTECPSIQEFFDLLIIYNQVLIWNWRKEKGEVIQTPLTWVILKTLQI